MNENNDQPGHKTPSLPLYYPEFNALPDGLFEMRATVFAEERPTVCSNERREVNSMFIHEPQLTDTDAEKSKKLWESHNDYLWMLAITHIDFLNGLSLAESNLRYGGFGFLIIIGATLKYAVFVGMLSKLILNFGAHLIFDFKYCISPTYKGAECINSTITGIRNSILYKSKECKSIRGTLYIQCESDDKLYILSSSTIIDNLYTNLNIEYGGIILTLIIFILMIRFIELELPNFLKLFKLISRIFVMYDFFLLITCLTLQGEMHFKDMMRMSSFSLTGLFESICLSLPKLADSFVTTASCTARLPLCTQPAVDSAVVNLGRLVLTVGSNAVFILMNEIICDNYHIALSIMSDDYLPFSIVALYMNLLPFETNIWITVFFMVSISICFMKQLALLEAIYSNFVWYFGYNKFLLSALYFFIGTVCVCALVNIMLMIWSGWHLTSTFQVFILMVVIGSVVIEVIVRIVFLSYDSDAQIHPRPRYGPPNSTLRDDRKYYVLESKRISSMYAIKANTLFRKLKVKGLNSGN